MAEKSEAVREDMTKFWKEHAKDASLDEMMLMSGASAIDKKERPEVLALLPDIGGKKVLELGAGIGRFTGELAQEASHVTAVDFMEQFISKNKEQHGHLGNIDFRQADVTTLELPKNSFDVIFSNWLMMYLADEEILKLADKMSSWLKEDGFLFFRESCYHQSGDKDRTFNPTKYRSPAFYNALFQSAGSEEGGKNFGFEMIFSRSIQTYVELKNNQNQYCWLLHKTQQDTTANHGFETFQKFLDSRQYTRNSILSYEKVFGDGYVSTGGPETTEAFVAMLNLKSGQRVLDVGCGIGGGDFYMAKQYGADVVGMDLSTNMIEIAMERVVHNNGLKVQFEMADVTKRNYPPETFDVVYSRDTILHIKDKPVLFKKFLTWLKPGGKLLISDYCCGEPPHSEAFDKYVAQRGYTLCTPPEYGKLIEAAGFVNVKAEDRSWQFTDMLTKEKKWLHENKETFLKDHSEADYQGLMDGWTNKLVRVDSGNQKWGLIYAEKAAQ
ncbi:uncharacterized protein [Amphiura filiformis]|uniref:uncharacterized protein n=1 Tax=Amphiura filiformis TaxID=82378 RepID=UPI003B2217E8